MINTNYADSYHRVQISFVSTHQAILTHQNIMQRRKLIAMMELVQELSDLTRASRGNLPSFQPSPGHGNGGVIAPAGSLCRGGPEELLGLLCNQGHGISGGRYKTAKQPFSPLFPQRAVSSQGLEQLSIIQPGVSQSPPRFPLSGVQVCVRLSGACPPCAHWCPNTVCPALLSV